MSDWTQSRGMKCQTTMRGVSCDQEATHVVNRGCATAHVTCDNHAECWRIINKLYMKVDVHRMAEANSPRHPLTPSQ